jgi:hypothetical protein
MELLSGLQNWEIGRRAPRGLAAVAWQIFSNDTQGSPGLVRTNDLHAKTKGIMSGNDIPFNDG